MPVVGTKLFGSQVAYIFLRNLIEADQPINGEGEASIVSHNYVD